MRTDCCWYETCRYVIICLISEDYCKSKSCRMEATYALEKLQTTKSVIPVLLQKHELPDWLGKLHLKMHIFAN